jgi:hypothetical protein
LNDLQDFNNTLTLMIIPFNKNQGSEIRDQRSEIRDQGAGIRDQGSEIRMQGEVKAKKRDLEAEGLRD